MMTPALEGYMRTALRNPRRAVMFGKVLAVKVRAMEGADPANGRSTDEEIAAAALFARAALALKGES